MESKSTILEEHYNAYEIAEMLNTNYKAVSKRIRRANMVQTKKPRINIVYASSELDKIKVPKVKRFITEVYHIYESKMNYL